MSGDLRSRSFDHLAALYEAARPGYPEDLVDRVVELARLDAESRLLEVGCGTGKATRLFASRGYQLLALEPGTDLAQIAQARVADYPRTRVEIVVFEEWRGGDGSFDLAFVAQAFHLSARDSPGRRTALCEAAWAIRSTRVGCRRGGGGFPVVSASLWGMGRPRRSSGCADRCDAAGCRRPSQMFSASLQIRDFLAVGVPTPCRAQVHA